MLIYKDGLWALKEIDVKVFAPVMLGMSFNEVQRLSVPDAQKQYLIDEQILSRRVPDVKPAIIKEPFEVNMKVDNSTQPPPYNP